MRLQPRARLLVAALLAGVIPSAAFASSSSPSELLASIVAAARAEQSVHYTSAGTYGAVHVSFVGDAGVSQGIQRITYATGAQTGHVTVLVSADIAYVRGDAFTLVDYMGFKPSVAAKYAGVWILIPHTDKAYAAVAAGVKLSSTIDELRVSGQLTTAAGAQADGRRVLGVRATRSVSGHTVVETLYARAAGPPLPVEEIASRDTVRFSAAFGRWNEPIHARGAVPISVVQSSH